MQPVSKLDHALFPLLVLVERLGPIGVVDLADHVGRDYTTVSRQLAKMESLGLIERHGSASDRRVREAVATPAGKALTDRIDTARDLILRRGLAEWPEQEIGELIRLMEKFAEAMRLGLGLPLR